MGRPEVARGLSDKDIPPDEKIGESWEVADLVKIGLNWPKTLDD